jgi:hypothetical protein
VRSLYLREVRMAIVCDNFSPHLTTKRDQRVGVWAEANNVEIAHTPTDSSWLNRIEAQFTALRYFALDGTDHHTHREQGSMIRRYIAWRNRNAEDRELRRIVNRANVACAAPAGELSYALGDTGIERLNLRARMAQLQLPLAGRAKRRPALVVVRSGASTPTSSAALDGEGGRASARSANV